MPTFSTLEHVTIPELTNAFNKAFADYLIPLQLTPEQLQHKIATEDVDLALSAGAFENNELVGFILHGCRVLNGKKVLYNAGTGVIPEQRGKGLTLRMYDYFYTLPGASGVSSIQLEVITENIAAIKTYERAGFRISRTLHCYKGQLSITAKGSNHYEIKSLEDHDRDALSSFWDWEPAWQNSERTAEAQKDLAWIGAYDGGHLAGYLAFHPKSKRILQFAVHSHYRRKGIGSQLFGHVAKHYGAGVALINVNSGSAETLNFLASLGLEKFLSQYEMKWEPGTSLLHN